MMSHHSNLPSPCLPCDASNSTQPDNQMIAINSPQPQTSGPNSDLLTVLSWQYHSLTIAEVRRGLIHSNRSRRILCQHRQALPLEGPPCYTCSLHDAPPRYSTVSVGRWCRTRRALLQLYRRTLTVATHRLPECSLSQPAPPLSLPPSYSANTDHNNDTPVFTVSQHCGHINYAFVNDNPSVPSSECASRGNGMDVLPPYTPPTPTSIISGYCRPSLPETCEWNSRDAPFNNVERAYENVQNIYCTKRCHVNMIYSLLLAVVTTVCIMELTQPWVVLLSSVFFLTLFLFMPLILAIERFLETCSPIRSDSVDRLPPVSLL